MMCVRPLSLCLCVVLAIGKTKGPQASNHLIFKKDTWVGPRSCKLTWLVLGGDPAARSQWVEQFTAL